MKQKFILLALTVIPVIFIACNNPSDTRERITLEGTWAFQLDTADLGVAQEWYKQDLNDFITLPGTTDTNKKGIYNTRRDETTYLSRDYRFIGKAWYKKQITVPADWRNKIIHLTLERTKPTTVWLDGNYVGLNSNISTRQVYDLTDYLTPGNHDIVIMVDNGESVPRQLLSNSHAYTESTQTNWNGIIGEIFLEAKNPLYIKSVKVSPDAANKTASVKVEIENARDITPGIKLEFSAKAWNTPRKHQTEKIIVDIESSKKEYIIEYPLSEDALLWSEFNPVLYELTVSIKGIDSQKVNFGLRDFKAQGTQFTINNQLTFLRGKHDACVFPLTAHTAMDLDSWLHYFRVCKEYGINHVRFHSWCPPAACFEAADIVGIYLQPELPYWGGLTRSEEYLSNFLTKEGKNIQNEYGNHASFVLFALGNELSGDVDLMEEFLETFRQVDNRHLYAFGSNNFLGFKGQLPGEDFLVTCRIGGADDYSTHTRGSFSFADADNGGYINNTYPNSLMNFDGAIAGCTVPVISHETGQFQVYPNYDEMKKYTGVLRPDNFEVFRQRLEKAGMMSQANDFFRASGRWAALLYKADIEMDLRTEGFGGFQLLDLQDYPGQGSAYVGILDAFMDSKGLISVEEWREFCNDVVPLFETEKFCWTNNEILTGKIRIANYSQSTLEGKNVLWQIVYKSGEVIDKGSIPLIKGGYGLLDVGNINPSIAGLEKAQNVFLKLSIADTDYKNTYPLWIYPQNHDLTPGDNLTVTNEITSAIAGKLQNGEKVLWFPRREKLDKLTVGGLFQTDYWNYRMFKGICEHIGKPVSPGTLGILTEPTHPLFNDFPTDYHTNWQWYPIIKQSYPLIMDRLPEGYKPIVQVIDNIERNHRLGLVFEFNVDNGKLLVCMSDLIEVIEKPEARQFYQSMLNYMASDSFSPEMKISLESLNDLFSVKVESGKIEGVKNISYED